MERRRIAVRGIVQGVGFRPYVYALAREHELAGTVRNDARGVVIDIEGPPSALADFIAALPAQAPPLAAIESIETISLAPASHEGFRIVASDGGPARRALVSPDVATCDDCLGEMRDHADRRHLYPFLNCTNCGPRFTIVEAVPYDRERTSMRRFAMCAACRAEYENPLDRRFHAQPTACPACGPSLRWVGPDEAGEPLEIAAALLLRGRIVAVKGLGGYHLACDAADEAAVARLRARKSRDAKPFAVMAPDLDAARALVEIDAGAAALLVSAQRPIVLLRRRRGAPVASSVAPRLETLGIMLPYAPLHHLLLERVGRPIVLTSGNLADEPMAYDDGEALARLGPIADGFLTHDRAIVMRCDDSVLRWTGRRAVPVRRARGYAPRPVPLAPRTRRPVLALGGHLKNAFCLARGRHAFMSHHVGDLDTLEAAASLEAAIDHYERLFEIRPEVVACDLHPEYRSTRHARRLADRRGLPLVSVQHHHAHAASVLAEHGRVEPAIGIVLDGTGWGLDGTVWGFEFLLVDGPRLERLGRLEPIPLPGGEAAVQEPWRVACAWLTRAYGELPELDLPFLARVDRAAWRALASMIARGVRAPLGSSAGRLFDAAAAIAGLRDRAQYEGQAAMELEALAGDAEAAPYSFDVVDLAAEPGHGGGSTGDGAAPAYEVRAGATIRELAEEASAGAPAGRLAARFHETVVAMILAGAERARERTGLRLVALSGGTFQNARVLDGAIEALARAGFEPLVHERVPPNDGGIALGQASVAAWLTRSGRDDGREAASGAEPFLDTARGVLAPVAEA